GTCLERRARARVEIGCDQRVDSPGHGAARADIAGLRFHPVERGRILAHEGVGPGSAGQVSRESVPAKADATLAVLAVEIPTAMLRQAASSPQHRPHPTGWRWWCQAARHPR